MDPTNVFQQGTTALHVRKQIRPTNSSDAKDVNGMPEQFGRYRIERHLGQGGMGAVYLARDGELDRNVALKLPFFGEDDPLEVINRFKREARAVAALQHPNICPVYDVGEVDGLHYMTMAFIEGKTLSQYIRRKKPLEVRPVVHLVRKVALALDEAHRNGIVHRDLKPANIMINGRGEPVVMDFGLARRQGLSDEQVTRDGMIVGTPQYMAPEQIAGKTQVGPRCDVYSMGVILYVLLTSRLPYQSDDLLSLLSEIATQDPPLPSKYRSDVDNALDAICSTALAKQPQERYASARALADDLLGYLKGEAKPVPKPPKQATPKPPSAEEITKRDVEVTKPGSDSPPEFGSSVRFPALSESTVRRSLAARTKPRFNPTAAAVVAACAAALVLVMLVAGIASAYHAWDVPSEAAVPRAPEASTVIDAQPSLPALDTTNTSNPAVISPGPVKIFIVAGQPSVAGRVTETTLQQFANDIDARGQLPYQLRDQQKWVQRDDVWVCATDLEGESRSGPLSIGFGESRGELGPEYGIGQVLGNHFDEQVVIIRVSAPAYSLGDEFQPPNTVTPAGFAYEDLVEEVSSAIEDLDGEINVDGRGMEVAGLFWFQGVADGMDEDQRKSYAQNLNNLIRNFRHEFESPRLDVVVIEHSYVPSGGEVPASVREHAEWLQSAHAEIGSNPEFADSVVFAISIHDTPITSPDQTEHMFHADPLNLLNVGHGCADAMLNLLSKH